MSRRLILQTTSKLLTTATTTIHRAPCCLVLLASHTNTTVHRGQIRTISQRAKVTSRKVYRADRLGYAVLELSDEAYNKIFEETDMKRKETFNLFYAIRWRLIQGGSRFIYDCLRNRETWLRNPTKIPKTYNGPWERSLGIDDEVKVSLDAIGPYPDEIIGRACHIMGLDLLSQAQTNNDKKHMSFGCLMLEIAVLYGRWDAAANLLNYHNDPITAGLMMQASLDPDTREAETLIRDLATRNPHQAPASVMLVFLRDLFSPKKIISQKPDRLQWGYDISDLHVPRLSVLEDTLPFDVYPHPAQIRLQILEHCMSKKISLPKIPLDIMPQLRDDVLAELAVVNGPHACMIIALRENGPAMYSKDWERLLLAAAAGGIPQACRLLSIHYMRKEGIIPIGPNSREKLKSSLGLEFGRICIMALVDNPRDFELYTLALAALCRTADDYPRGLSILKESLAMVEKDTRFPKVDTAKLREHIKDYGLTNPGFPGYWNEQGMAAKLWFLEPESFMKKARNAYQ